MDNITIQEAIKDIEILLLKEIIEAQKSEIIELKVKVKKI